MDAVEVLQRLAVALAIGLLLGLERERSHAAERRQALGSRTFALLSLSGALAAGIDPVVVAAGALAAGAVLAVGYLRTAPADPGATTEVAGLAAYLLGASAWARPGPAVAAAVVVAVLLAAKSQLHRFAREVVTEAEVEDSLKLFVVAFVVLPLLPDRDLGPYAALNPARIWFLVVAVTAIGWVGYVATRAFGAERGLPVAGFAGGFVSGSATTGAMGRRARADPSARSAALAGALLASLATLCQLAAITAVANPGLLRRLLPALVLGGAVLAAEAALVARRGGRSAAGGPSGVGRPAGARVPSGAGRVAGARAPSGAGRPAPLPAAASARAFALWPALVLAAVLTAVLLLARWGGATFGAAGAVLTAGLAGLADVHAAVLSAATLAAAGSVDLGTAVAASGVALAANTTVKCVLAAAGGGRGFGLRFAALILPPSVVVAGGLILTG